MDAAEPPYASARSGADAVRNGVRGAAVDEGRAVRGRYAGGGAGFADDFDRKYDGSPDGDAEFGQRAAGRSPGGVRLSFHGWMAPKALWARIALGCAAVVAVGSVVAGMLVVRNFLERDEHFTVQGPSSIQIAGNSHLTRAQLLSVFGGDVERNIFAMPLTERRAELERLPWVGHATVMRLLPNRVRVAIVERTPVAFVRQGGQIGLVDENGVLLDLAEPVDPDRKAAYSFPVLTGISPSDPQSVRAARMKIYTEFMSALDATGEHISRRLSEVDLSNPEDVRAVVPDSGGSGADILVHFGEEKYLERFKQYEQHLPEWRAQYPKLASVDMRYERQVVLEMQKGAEASATAAANAPAAPSNAPVAIGAKVGTKPSMVKQAAVVKTKPPAAAKNTLAASKPAATVARPGGVASPAPAAANATAVPVHHLTTAFTVTPRPSLPLAHPATPAAKAAATAQGGPR